MNRRNISRKKRTRRFRYTTHDLFRSARPLSGLYPRKHEYTPQCHSKGTWPINYIRRCSLQCRIFAESASRRCPCHLAARQRRLHPEMAGRGAHNAHIHIAGVHTCKQEQIQTDTRTPTTHVPAHIYPNPHSHIHTYTCAHARIHLP